MILINAWIVFPYLSAPTGMNEMRDYVNANVGPDDIIIADSRIYRGRIMWLFMGTHYLESGYFSQITEQSKNLPGKERPYKIFFVECVPDDCGWGTVKDQPELNASSEQMVQFFKENAQQEAVITGGGSPGIAAGTPYFNVYSATVQLKPGIMPTIDSTHSFFYYPVRYTPKSQIFDSYAVNGSGHKLLFLAAQGIIWLSFGMALVAIILLSVLFYRTVKKDINNSDANVLNS